MDLKEALKVIHGLANQHALAGPLDQPDKFRQQREAFVTVEKWYLAKFGEQVQP